jgi:hypothetical protein
MNTAINQGFTAKLAEIYPFKRTQRLRGTSPSRPIKSTPGGIYSTPIIIVVASGIH